MLRRFVCTQSRALRLPAAPLRRFSSAAAQYKKPGTAGLNWSQLGFTYSPSNCYIRYTWKDGKWEEKPTISNEPYINLHITSNALHYGQAVFEGLKAFHCKDGKVRVFASNENSARLNKGADRLNMPPVPLKMFNDTIDECVRLNSEFVPPYGSNGSMYIRPMLFGNGAQLDLGPAPEYTFAVVVVPIGNYYKTGLKAIDALVIDRYDRAAPQGIGNIKAAGNYGADAKPAREAASKGYPIALYLDAKEHKYVEEFSTSNFIAIDSSGAFVTPKSDSVLGSVTNKVLQQLARDMGLPVNIRPIEYKEIEDGKLKEVAACGTAVVITPIKSITRDSKKSAIGELNILQKLCNKVRAVQVLDEPDKHSFHRVVM